MRGGSSGSLAFTEQDERLDPSPWHVLFWKHPKCKDSDNLVQIEHSMFNLQDRPSSESTENAVLVDGVAHKVRRYIHLFVASELVSDVKALSL